MDCTNAWSENPEIRNQFPYSDENYLSADWVRAMHAARERALRHFIARNSEAPELEQPPLTGFSLPEAIHRLATDLFGRSAWGRLYLLLVGNQMGSPLTPEGDQSSNTQAIKLFLTAKNFEDAEQWDAAVAAYRRVLGLIGEFVPVEAAAERLRSLKSSHPELFRKTVEKRQSEEEKNGGVH